MLSSEYSVPRMRVPFMHPGVILEPIRVGGDDEVPVLMRLSFD